MNKLQNSPYFCVLKYARPVKQKAGARLKTESETGERRCFFLCVFSLASHALGRVRLARFARIRLLRHASSISLLILRKKTDCFAVQVMNGYYSKSFMS